MNVREAKDFLINQTAEQASLDAVPLSELEKRLMYFTESDDSCENPVALNAEFEAQYDAAEYEQKITRLMAHAYRRIKKEGPERLRLWNDAFRVLQKSDHYILVFWRQPALHRSPRSWPLYVAGCLAAAGLYALTLFFFGSRRNMRRGEPAPIDRYIPALSPAFQRALQFIFLLMIVFAIFP